MDNQEVTYDRAQELFPDTDIADGYKMISLEMFLGKVAHSSIIFQVYISVLGILLTIPHFFILTRESVMTSSVISMMTGVAFCDFVSMVATLVSSGVMFDTAGTECSPPASLLLYRVSWAFLVFRDFVRRASTWLGVLMALIRYLVIKFSTQHKFQSISSIPFGLYCCLVCFAFSSIISIVYYFRFDFEVESEWRPSKTCSDYSPSTVLPIVVQKMSTVFTEYSRLGRWFMFFNGFVSKILPCVFLPILTVLLISIISQSHKGSIGSSIRKKRSERTTILVIIMAVAFFFVELPVGISISFQALHTGTGYLLITSDVNHICTTIFLVNATCHSLMCFMMSSQYRRTVVKAFGMNRKKNSRGIAIVSNGNGFSVAGPMTLHRTFAAS